MSHFVLLFAGPDRRGILAASKPLLAAHGCDVRDAKVYGDPDTGPFFVRLVLASDLGRE
jgi:formyltetrahydrofolate deformylase